jgi:hypothetical protein
MSPHPPPEPIEPGHRPPGPPIREQDAAEARAELDELQADAHAESERAIEHLTAGQRPRFHDVTGGELPTREELAATYAPADHDEELIAAQAVHRHREDAEALELLDKLGTFEQLLLERAFNAGVNATLAKMRKAVGSAAATVHAEPLMRLSRPPALNARRLKPHVPGGWQGELQASRIALDSAQAARAAHDPPAGQRMLDVRQALDALEERLRRHHVAEDEGEAQDVEAELDLVDRLRGTLDDVERLVATLRDAVEGEPA